jgi:hypothetical protein
MQTHARCGEEVRRRRTTLGKALQDQRQHMVARHGGRPPASASRARRVGNAEGAVPDAPRDWLLASDPTCGPRKTSVLASRASRAGAIGSSRAFARVEIGVQQSPDLTPVTALIRGPPGARSRAGTCVAAMKATDQSNVAAAQGRLTDATRCGSSQQTIENHAAAAPADQAGRRQPEGCPAANAEISSTASGSAACAGQ